MIRNGKAILMQVLILSTLAGTAGTLTSCSNKKTEETTSSSTASTDTSMGFMGRQGDTTGSDPTMSQQAPVDNTAGGDTAINEIRVMPKK